MILEGPRRSGSSRHRTRIRALPWRSWWLLKPAFLKTSLDFLPAARGKLGLSQAHKGFLFSYMPLPAA